MKNHRVLLFMILVLSYSCVSGQKDHVVSDSTAEGIVIDEEFDYLILLEEEIVGVWENSSMRVWVNTYNNSDTSFFVDINEDSWELKLSIMPIVTTIRDDGTYTSEFRNTLDQVIYTPEGTWMVDGDSLIMEDHQAVYRYQIFIDGDIAEFKSMIDWDQDGKADDAYAGVQRKKK